MNFGAILAQYHKKLDVNLLIDLHLDDARKQVPQKTNAQILAF